MSESEQDIYSKNLNTTGHRSDYVNEVSDKWNVSCIQKLWINEFEILSLIFHLCINNNIDNYRILRADYLPDISCKFSSIHQKTEH